MASLGIKLLRNQTTNSQHSVSPQFHHAAHGYTLSNTIGVVGGARDLTEGPLVRVQRGSMGPVLRLPVEIEWGGVGGDEPVCTYDPDMFYDESGVRRSWTVSPSEMGLTPADIWRLIEYYTLYNAAYAREEDPAPSSEFLKSQALYEGIRDSVLQRALGFLEEREREADKEREKAIKGIILLY
jgi:hypothetical protein